jgi:hypothetical protein
VVGQSGVRKWWRVFRTRFEPAIPFTVECRCGAPLVGRRNATFQVRICAICRAEVFILGRSPLPLIPEPAGALEKGTSTVPTRPTRSRRPWLLPVVAALVTLALAGGGLFLLLNVLNQVPGQTMREEFQTHQEAGAKAWQEENYALAAYELKEAQKLREQLGDPTASDAARRLDQMQLEADLVASTLGQPLMDKLDEWQGISDEDLHKLFAEKQGRAVVFDVDISRDSSGLYHQHALGRELPRMDLRNLPFLRKLPLHEEQRLIFGVKLDSVKRDSTVRADHSQRWTVSFQSDSLVLITDAKIARALGLKVDDQTARVLERQAGWLRDLLR